MDSVTDEAIDMAPEPTALSYDESVPYEELVTPSEGLDGNSLASRIGRNKIYVLPDSTGRDGKRKREDEDEVLEESDEEEDMMDEDPEYRSNALLFRGPPISQLPTQRIQQYAKHFKAAPLGLEWVDDQTCILVFKTKTAARLASQLFQKLQTEIEDEEGFLTAKSFPMSLWPLEERIKAGIGKTDENLKGVIKYRWARKDDVKKKGASQASQFYKKHGSSAGKEGYDDIAGPNKRRRRLSGDLEQRIELDRELDNFLDGDDPGVTPPPPSKMRSDYIAGDGRTLLERTSELRAHDPIIRPYSPLPRKSRGSRGRHQELDDVYGEHEVDRRRHGGSQRDRRHDREERRRDDKESRSVRPKKTQQELDDELDAFLKEKS